jgi:hypothetical protein
MSALDHRAHPDAASFLERICTDIARALAPRRGIRRDR